MKAKRTHTLRLTFSRAMTQRQARKELARLMAGVNTFADLAQHVWDHAQAPKVEKVTFAREVKRK